MSEQIEYLNRNGLELNFGDCFTLEDFIPFDEKNFGKQDRSIRYHMNKLAEDAEDYEPIEVDHDGEVLDGYHRLAAMAYLANKYPDEFNFDYVKCLIKL